MALNLECDFVFDGISSVSYDMRIMQLENTPDTSPLVSNKNFTIVAPARISKYKILDVSDSEVFSFDVQIFPITDKYMTPNQIKNVTNWLFNKDDFKKLQILSEELSGVYFNCILKDAKQLLANDKTIGISFTVECDANGGWTFPQTKMFALTQPSSGTVPFMCDSTEEYGMKPILEIDITSDCNFSMTNETTGQHIQVNNLNAGEVVIIDCENQIISSSLGNYLFDDFNGEFLYLPQGMNQFTLSGIGVLKLTYQEQVKVGW